MVPLQAAQIQTLTFYKYNKFCRKMIRGFGHFCYPKKGGVRSRSWGLGILSDSNQAELCQLDSNFKESCIYNLRYWVMVIKLNDAKNALFSLCTTFTFHSV